MLKILWSYMAGSILQLWLIRQKRCFLGGAGLFLIFFSRTFISERYPSMSSLNATFKTLSFYQKCLFYGNHYRKIITGWSCTTDVRPIPGQTVHCSWRCSWSSYQVHSVIFSGFFSIKLVRTNKFVPHVSWKLVNN